jgi:putative radical SAM enzyme (TIGR03279 family)
VPVSIKQIAPDSPAELAGLSAGDIITSISGMEVNDYLDVELALADNPAVELRILRAGVPHTLPLDREGPLGELLPAGMEVGFAPRTCPNKCLFCFIDQNPPGLRSGIYIKDEDYRLSFTDGAYITLTNLTAEDKARIVSLKLSPLYVSVHATDDHLRRHLLGNPLAPPIIPALAELTEGGISLHAQIVAIPGINDGSVLADSLKDLAKLQPGLASIAVVPVGLTRWRNRLPAIAPVDSAKAKEILGIIDEFQRGNLHRQGTRLAFPADELFIKAGRVMPSGDYYQGFPQLEDGVGLWTYFKEGFLRTVQRVRKQPIMAKITVATSVLAEPLLREIGGMVKEKWGVEVEVVAVPNRLFGESVGVAGLLSGKDILDSLGGRELGEAVLVPAVALNAEGNFIDDIAVSRLSEELGLPVQVVAIEGEELVRALVGEKIGRGE